MARKFASVPTNVIAPIAVARKETTMTDRQALTEAQRRWGKKAAIEKRPRPTVDRKTGCMALDTHRVGHIGLGMFFNIEGHGPNWAEAFESVG